VIGKDPLGDLEGEPAPRKLRERICGVGAIRVDQPRRACGLRWDRVVIDYADKDPCVARLFNTRAISGAAIDCDQEFDAILDRRADRPFGDPMPIGVSLRDVPLSDRPRRAQGANEDCSASEAVGIEVADDKHRLALRRCGAQPRDQSWRVREERWVVQRCIARVEEAARNGRVGKATLCEKRTDVEVESLGESRRGKGCGES
jgi:hypothetical protein